MYEPLANFSTLSHLDWPALIEHLKTLFSTPQGKSLIDNSLFLASPEDVSHTQKTIQEILDLDRQNQPLRLGPVHDIYPLLDATKKHKILDGVSIYQVGITLESLFNIKRCIEECDEKTYPRLSLLVKNESIDSDLTYRILHSIDSEGNVYDDASPILKELRLKKQALSNQVKNKLDSFLQDEYYQPYLREDYITLRNDRYVIPVKSEFQGMVPGIIHDVSQTNQTVFVEPTELVQLGNKLLITQKEIEEEILNIRRSLSSKISLACDTVEPFLNKIGLIDKCIAFANFAKLLDAQPIVPQKENSLQLYQMRHPLLCFDKQTQVIANDLCLQKNQKVLLLTGPNTGGKTVALKSIGLACLMSHCGMYVPCHEKSTLPWYDSIFATVGDMQSIEHGLSSFAAHITSINQVLQKANEHSLVLIDEIVSDTDPSEGEALSQAIIEHFVSKQSSVIVTTHHQGLKRLAFVDSRYRNGGMGFDPKTFRPTYKVILDTPAQSTAVEIAQTLQLPNTVIKRAKDLLSGEQQEWKVLLVRLHEQKHELEQELQKVKEKEWAIIEKAKRLEKERLQLHEEAQIQLLEDKKEIHEKLSKAQSIVTQVIKTLQGGVTLSDTLVKQVMNGSKNAQKELELFLESITQKEEKRSDAVTSNEIHFKVGDMVIVDGIRKGGKILEIDMVKRKALLEMGAIRSSVALENLRSFKTMIQSKSSAVSSSVSYTQSQSSDDMAEQPPLRTENVIDLRGKYVDEAIIEIETAIQQYSSDSIKWFLVIHGHGTGRLKEALKRFFKTNQQIKGTVTAKPQDGGTGATWVQLK